MKITYYIILFVFVLEPMGPKIIEAFFEQRHLEYESAGVHLNLDHAPDPEYYCEYSGGSSIIVSGTLGN